MQFPTEKNLFSEAESAVYIVRRLLFHAMWSTFAYIQKIPIKGEPLTCRRALVQINTCAHTENVERLKLIWSQL